VPARGALVHEWERRLGALLPGVRATRTRGLALLALGLLLARSVALPRAAAALPLAASHASVERRLRRWLANGGVAPAALWARLLPGLVAGEAGREVLLVFDPTPFRGCGTLLVLGLVRGKRALPVAWRVVPRQAPWPAPLGPLLAGMFAAAAAALPAGCAVTVLADRGLVGPGLVDACRAVGWDLVLRLRAGAGEQTRVRLGGGAERRVAGLPTGPGQRWRAAAAVFEEAGWRPGWVTVGWDRAAAEPWVLCSTRAGGAARVREDRRRTSAEATSQDLKGRGFGLERSKLADPARLDRLLLALALALWWADDLGARAVRAGLRRRHDRPGRGTRARSRLRIGLAWLDDLLAHGRPPPLPFRPAPDGWLHPWLA
jgi:hypothetical protein